MLRLERLKRRLGKATESIPSTLKKEAQLRTEGKYLNPTRRDIEVKEDNIYPM